MEREYKNELMEAVGKRGERRVAQEKLSVIGTSGKKVFLFL